MPKQRRRTKKEMEAARALEAQKKQNKLIAKERKESITNKHRDHVSWQCIKCKRFSLIRITIGNEEHYTEERQNNYVCLLCKGRKKNVK